MIKLRRHVSLARKVAEYIPLKPQRGSLIVMLASMGDLLLASGAIKHIAAHSAGGTCVVINDYAAPVIDILDLPNVHWVKLRTNSMRNLFRLIPVFRCRWKRVIHAVYSTNDHSHEICMAAQSECKVWFNGNPSDAGEVHGSPLSMYNQLITVNEGEHELDKLRKMVASLGCGAVIGESLYPAVNIAGADCQQSNPVKIAICPGGRFSQKKWPGRNFSEVIRSLTAKHTEAEFVLLGGSGDVNVCAEIEALCADDRIKNLCGQLSVRQSVEEMAGSGLCIGNDSFALHAAIAVGTPSVVIMGGGDYPRWIPWKDVEKHRMVMCDCEYQGCGWKCKFSGDELYKCVRAVTVEDVDCEISLLRECANADKA